MAAKAHSLLMCLPHILHSLNPLRHAYAFALICKQTTADSVLKEPYAHGPDSPLLSLKPCVEQIQVIQVGGREVFSLIFTSSVTLWVSTPIFLFN